MTVPVHERTLINVCGMPRSGTTMLGLMLATGEEAISCGEASSWFRVARYRADGTVPDSFQALKNVEEQHFHHRLMDRHGARFAVDSSKDLDWIIDHTRLGPDNHLNVYNILIYKSPVDIALSWWKRGEFDRWRRYFLRYHYQILFSGVDFCTVSYDALVETPRQTIQSVCALTGLPYFEGKELFWRHDHEMLGTNSRGVRNQLERGASEIKKPSIPPDFAPLAAQVERASSQDRLIQHLLGALKERDVARRPPSKPAAPHRYRPTASSRLAYTLYRFLKLPWLRFRWNVLEPRLGPFGSVS